MYDLMKFGLFEIENERRKRSISRERTVETLVVADQSMAVRYKHIDLENYLLTLMNMVTIDLRLFSHDLTILNIN